MEKRYVLGVDIGGTNVRVGVVREGNTELVRHFGRVIGSHEDEETVLNQIFQSIDSVWGDGIAGIGVGVPSVVDVEKGIVYSVENIPSWKEVHLKERLEEKYGVSVYVNNDANCFALGECYFGKARHYKDVVGLTIGTGIGAGIVINRHIYNGANCGAGEIGMIPYRDTILEHYCSGQFFQKEHSISGGELFQRANKGDGEARRIFDTFGHHLGSAIMTVLYAYDPQIIVFGGSVSKSYPFFEKSMHETLKGYAYRHALDRLVIERGENENIPILGAAALYYDATGMS